MSDARRQLPSVSSLMERDSIRALLSRAPRSLLVEVVRATIDEARNGRASPSSDAEWSAAVSQALERAQTPSLRRVINATGVVLHTNLGRAPLARTALDAMQRVAAGYSNLEYDVDAGSRGSRYAHCAALLRELTGAEDALVVNNNAGALVLALNTLARGREAVVSRGELVEIGGSFRIPDIMERSGTRLVEVGTTNRTHIEDYGAALNDATGAIVKVHRSNFAMEGFVAEVDTRSLATLARHRELPLIHDLGSGLLVRLDDFGLSGEPTASEALSAGASVLTMSGDKLLGGPQAGIIVGSARLVRMMRENPMTRAFRVDKLTLAALEATLALYRDPKLAFSGIPALAMLSAPLDQLRTRGEALRRALGGRVQLVESHASVGGGAFPNAKIPSFALAIDADVVAAESRLRLGDPAIIGRVSDGRLLLDLRTIFAEDDDVVRRAIEGAAGH